MLYSDGRVVRLGDQVRLRNGVFGIVVVSVDTNEFSDGYPAGDWAELQKGVLILTDNGALVAINTNDDEDIAAVHSDF